MYQQQPNIYFPDKEKNQFASPIKTTGHQKTYSVHIHSSQKQSVIRPVVHNDQLITNRKVPCHQRVVSYDMGFQAEEKRLKNQKIMKEKNDKIIEMLNSPREALKKLQDNVDEIYSMFFQREVCLLNYKLEIAKSIMASKGGSEQIMTKGEDFNRNNNELVFKKEEFQTPIKLKKYEKEAETLNEFSKEINVPNIEEHAHDLSIKKLGVKNELFLPGNGTNLMKNEGEEIKVVDLTNGNES